MQFILLLGVGISVYITLHLLLVPDRYGICPGNLTIDLIQRKLRDFYSTENEELKIIGKSPDYAIKASLFIGLAFGLLGWIATVHFIGPYSCLVAILLCILGLLLVKWVLGNEFKKWQSQLLIGVAQMVNFVPAFLSVGTIIPLAAFKLSLEFIPEPFKGELSTALDRISRKAEVDEAMDRLIDRARHPLVDAICSRLKVSWDHRFEPTIFDDLSDQIKEINEMAAAKATVAKSATYAVLAIIGLIGALFIYGFPAYKVLMEKVSGGFGM
ncbi:hypothetical protein [Desulfotomaculum nigrificans]|uniref:hypothetical protein n=1 Tax=Desulfotomaculum nigrificans TaxID=1565 RepID=UPI0001FAE593|nr:hypothetical protein [Desulfotomaculum nigrificans]